MDSFGPISMNMFAGALVKLQERVVPLLPGNLKDMTFQFLREPSMLITAHLLVAAIFASALICAYLTAENFLWKNPAHKLSFMGLGMLLAVDSALGYTVYMMVA